MEVQLLRAPSGAVIFLEANSDFVDMLIGLLKAPLGALMQSCVDSDTESKAELPFLSMTKSIPQLRDAVFSAPKSEVTPKPVTWDDVLTKQHIEEMKVRSDKCLYCLKSGAQRQLQQGRFCNHCALVSGPHDLQASSTCRNCRQVLNPRPNGTCPQCNQAMCIVVVNQAHLNAAAHCARCVAKSQMANGRTCSNCKSGNVRTCNSCSWCDACSVQELGFEVEGLTTTKTNSTQAPAAFLKDTAKFMITNKLEVFEVSPVKMIELMAGQCDGFKGLKTSTVTVTKEHVKELVFHAFCGSSEVLTATFPAKGAEVEAQVEIGSDAGTDGSFEMSFSAER